MALPTLVFPENLTDVNNVTRRMYPKTFGFTAGREHFTDIEQAFDGGEQTRARYDEDAFGTWKYTTTMLDPRQAYGMRAFLRVARGRANKFWFTKPDEEFWEVRQVAVTNGASTLDFNLRDAYDFTDLLVDGVSWPNPYTFTNNSGTYGQDSIDWLSDVPAQDLPVTLASVWGREVWVSRLDSDQEIFNPYAGGANAVLGDGPIANPRLFVFFDLIIRATKPG